MIGEDEGVAGGRVGHGLEQAEQRLAQVPSPLRLGAVWPKQGGNVGAGLRDALFEDEVSHKSGDALGRKGERLVV